jgi:DHA2 family methylenomycin A resistance protein-like MFS transporter
MPDVPLGRHFGHALLPSLTFLLLDSLPPSRAGSGGLFNASRQTGRALAVAVFGVLASGTSGSFLAGMRVSMLISAVLLAASCAAAFGVFRGKHPRRA